MRNVPEADIVPPHLHLPEIRHHVPSTDGSVAMAYDWGGDGPPLVFAHATGLHSHVWLPTVLALRYRYHCYAVDVRAQGEATVQTNTPYHWAGVADDFCVSLDALGLIGHGDLHAVGHSQGGYAVVESARRHPGTFSSVFVYEPVIFAPPTGAEDGTATESQLGILARKRRDVFASRQAALDNFRGKGPFALIDEDVLRCYVHWGFHDLPDGTVHLACRPEHEAALFDQSFTTLFDELAGVDCHVTAAVGEFTNDNFLTSVPQVVDRLSNADLVKLPGRTHFGVFEGVAEMAELIHTSLSP